MKAILAIFRGEASLASAPEQVFETTTTSSSPSDTTTTTRPPSATTTTTTTATTATTATTEVQPVDTNPPDLVKGFVPSKDVQC